MHQYAEIIPQWANLLEITTEGGDDIPGDFFFGKRLPWKTSETVVGPQPERLAISLIVMSGLLLSRSCRIASPNLRRASARELVRGLVTGRSFPCHATRRVSVTVCQHP